MTHRRAIDRATAAWRRRELSFPPRLRRMTPDGMDYATGAFPPPTYEINADDRAAGGQSITCNLCGLTSYHPRDVAERYCGRCHIFHDEEL